jgi:hypothetical protein
MVVNFFTHILSDQYHKSSKRQNDDAMNTLISIPEPLVFNPLKHHLGYIKNFIHENTGEGRADANVEVIRELRHIGGSVMDVYTGVMNHSELCDEFLCYIRTKKLSDRIVYSKWTGTAPQDFKTIYLSDGSQWVLKYQDNEQRFVHFFPARFSPYTFRIKANTLKSAVLYQIFIGKDFVTEEGLNTARAIAGLSQVKDIFDNEAITEMIELLRG